MRHHRLLLITVLFGLGVCPALSRAADGKAPKAAARPAGAPRAGTGSARDAQPSAVTPSPVSTGDKEPEVWPQVSTGLHGTLATLDAERSAAGFVRREIAASPRPGGSIEAIGWSGEGTIIVLFADRNGKEGAQVFDLLTGAKWTAPLDLPAFEYGASVAFTFLDETGPAPVLLVWYPWWEPESAKVVWAARIDCAARRVTVLSGDELKVVRRRAQAVAAPELREDDPHPGEHLRTLRVVSGDGRTRRTVGLPEVQPVADGLTLPIPTFRGGLNPNCRTVAYGADPPSFLFNVYPDALILDPLLEDVLDISPQMRIPTGDVVALRSDWPGKAVRQQWGSDAELTLACVDVAGDCVAFARRTETTFMLIEPPATASLRVFDQGEMHLWDLRIASPDYGVQLVDFTAQAQRGWPAGPPPGQSGWRAYWAEPPDTARSQPMGIEWPSLSPSGRRVVYMKGDAMWLAERAGDGEPAVHPAAE